MGTVGPNTVEFTDEGFSIGEQLFYRVRAESVYSANVNMLVSGAEEAVARLVEVYPNPANEVVNVKAPSGEKTFPLPNMPGVEVMSRSSARELTQLDIRSAPPGVYTMTTLVFSCIN